MPRSSSSTSTSASGTAAPEESRTIPEMVPAPAKACAARLAGSRPAISNAENHRGSGLMSSTRDHNTAASLKSASELKAQRHHRAAGLYLRAVDDAKVRVGLRQVGAGAVAVAVI